MIIDGLTEFISKIDRKYIDSVEEIVKTFRNYKIITIVTGNESEFKASQYSVKFVKALKEAQCGILFGYMGNQSFFTNVKLRYGVREDDIKAGEGYLILNNKFYSIKTPQNK